MNLMIFPVNFDIFDRMLNQKNQSTKGFRREENSALFLSERQYSGMYGRGL